MEAEATLCLASVQLKSGTKGKQICSHTCKNVYFNHVNWLDAWIDKGEVRVSKTPFRSEECCYYTSRVSFMISYVRKLVSFAIFMLMT